MIINNKFFYPNFSEKLDYNIRNSLKTSKINQNNKINDEVNFNVFKQVENLFLYMIFKSMKKNCHKNTLWINNSNAESMYQDMYDQYIIKMCNTKSLGLSKIIDQKQNEIEDNSVSKNINNVNDTLNKLNMDHQNHINFVNMINYSKTIF